MVDNVRQSRVTELPAQPDSGTVYFVKPTEADRGEVFVTGSDAQPVPFGVALASADEQEAGTRDDVAATPAGVQSKVEGEATARAQETDEIRASISNVDNTSDADKPVSTAQQAALDEFGATGIGRGTDKIGYKAPYPTSSPTTAFQIMRRLPLTPEQFDGAVADFDFATWSGTDNTAALQKMINAASQEGGREMRVPLGARYLTGTLYTYYDPVLNSDYAQRPGRIKITGEAQGYATGALDGSGAAFVHKDGIAGPLLSIVGTYATTGAPNSGGFVDLSGINLLGGSQTTAILYCEAVTDQLLVRGLTTRRKNKSGKGIDLVSCWKVNFDNVLNRGVATGLGPNEAGYDPANIDDGIGLDIRDNGNGGQINMAVFNNVENYRNGYGTRVGRRADGTGTYGPLVWIGGQDALNDYHGFWIDGGVYALTAVGRQIEQSRKAALRIDSNGATDIEHSIKWQGGYFTHCGKMEDGGPDSYAINIADGVNVEIDSPVFQNARSGIYFDRSKTKNLLIRRPELRTVAPWGATNGTAIGASAATLPVGQNIKLIDGHAVNGTATLISTDAQQAFALGNAGEYKSVSDNSATPSLTLGFSLFNKPVAGLGLNNSAPTTLTDIAGGVALHEVTLSWANTNTIVQSNGNIFLTGGVDFVPRNSRASLKLRRDVSNSYWVEVGRSNGAYDTRLLGAKAIPTSVPSTTAETVLATIPVPAGLLGTDGRIEVDLVFSVTNNANAKTLRCKYAGSTFAQYTVTAVASGRSLAGFQNRGVANSQVGSAGATQGGGTSASAVVTMTVDSSIAQNITITGQLANAADGITLESYVVRAVSGRAA